MQVLRHDKDLHPTRIQPHLKNVPEYLGKLIFLSFYVMSLSAFVVLLSNILAEYRGLSQYLGTEFPRSLPTTELPYFNFHTTNTSNKQSHGFFLIGLCCCISVPLTLRPSMAKSSRKRRLPHLSSQKNAHSTHGGKVSFEVEALPACICNSVFSKELCT